MTETRTFRVFVSSTFRDLEAERNYLHENVYPELRRLCAERGARFQPIDLRWGVSEEAALDQQALNVCLEEIERCREVTPRPNFIVLLGNRYGWLAPPPEVPADEFEAILGAIEQGWVEIRGKLRVQLDSEPLKTRQAVNAIVDISDCQAVLELLMNWYPRDDNADPPEHYLRPRARGGRYEAQDAWAPVEWVLQAVLAAGAARADRADPRYRASATEQEIRHGALGVGLVEGQAFCFVRELTDHQDPTTAPDDHPVRAFVDRDQQPLNELKKEFRGELPYREYRVPWDQQTKRPSTDYLEELARDVRAALEGAIGKQLAETHDGRDAEGEAHRAFAQERCRIFVGREKELAAIAAYLDGDEDRPLVMSGGGGTGKSALLAQALTAAQKAHDGAHVTYRFIGATASSSDGRSLLRSLCQELARRAGEDEAAVPTDYQELVPDFRARLEALGAKQPLIVFLDSLDQLSASQGARSLAWLPVRLPAGVRIVVSTRPEDTLTALKQRGAPIVELDPMPEADGAELLRKWLAEAHRKLQSAQMTRVLAKFRESAGNPLYLRLAFEEARRWRSDGALEDLATGVEGIIAANTFARLAQEDNHGQVLVSRALGYLAASRYGLAEDELLDLLSRDPEVYAWFLRGIYAVHGFVPPDLRVRAAAYKPELNPDQLDEWLEAVSTDPTRNDELGRFLEEALLHQGGPQLPVVLWSRLLFDLRPYLTERDADGASLITFFHRELGDVARSQFLDERAADYHGRMADYFAPGPGDDGRPDWAKATVRGLSELPFHQVEAQSWDALEETLTDFDFLEQKATRVAAETSTDAEGKSVTTYNGVRRLQDDFDLALRAMGGGEAADRPRIIVTATDFGQGMVIRCPHCNTVHTFATECSVCKQTHRLEDWVGKEVACTNPDCKGPLKVNSFTVGGDGRQVAQAVARPELEPEPEAEPEQIIRLREPPDLPPEESEAEEQAAPIIRLREPPDVPPEESAPPPDLPLASGAASLIEEAAPDGEAGVNGWLLGLLRRYGPMAESLCPGLVAQPLAAELTAKVRAGQPGDLVSREELVAAAARHAAARGAARIAERDLAVAILTAAGREVREA